MIEEPAPGQVGLWSPEVQRDAALDQVERAADPDWKAHALRAIQVVGSESRGFYEFTSDDIWDRLDLWGVPLPREPRALGALMMHAAREGWIHKTGRYEKSRLGRNHARPVAVYRSGAS